MYQRPDGALISSCHGQVSGVHSLDRRRAHCSVGLMAERRVTTLALLNPTGFVASWGYAAIFVLSVLQSCCVPTSSELTLGFGGVLAAQGTLSLPGVIAAGAAGEVVGAYIAWAVGRGGGRPLVERYGRYVLVSPADLDRAEGWYGRHERWGVLASRLLPLIRNFAAVPAGAARVSPLRFGILTAIGSLIWATAMALIGYAIGSRWQTVMKGFSDAGYLLGALAVIALAVVVWHRRRSYRAATRRTGHHAPPGPTAARRTTARRTFADDADSSRGAPASPTARPAVRYGEQVVAIEPGGVFPFSDYDSLLEPMILSALGYLLPSQLVQVRQYESTHLRRAAILARINLLLPTQTPATAASPPRALAAVPEGRDAFAAPAVLTPAASGPTPGSVGGLVDRAFGQGRFRRLSQATLDDVVDCLSRDRAIDAAFSAGHYLALGHEPEWSGADHLRMVQARRATIERDRRLGKDRAAASGCAALRLLTAELENDREVHASVVRSDLRCRLDQQEIDVRAASAAAELFLICGEWLPTDEDSAALIRAVRFDIAAQLQVARDPLVEAARVAMWLVASRGAHSRATDSRSRPDDNS
jgi:membrane protein DedA with SNARE-associated domain